MLAPLATLAFLAALWLLAVVAVQTLGESGEKIIAALKGRSLLAAVPPVPAVAARVTQRARPQRALRAQPRLRAAA